MNETERFSFVFLMDPYASLNLVTETSLLLMDELIARGHDVYWLQQEGLSLRDDQPFGELSRVESIRPFLCSTPQSQNLNRFDAILVRKDPPFDTGYLQLTLMLDFLSDSVVQFNSIKALREHNEKLLPLRWPELTPPTLVSMDIERLEAFLVEHRKIVLKPLNDCSGRGIVRVEWDRRKSYREPLSDSVHDENGKPRYVLAQKYLAGVHAGDKRVYLANGRPVGTVNRIPRPGQFLANIHQGASCHETELAEAENRAIQTIAPFLRREGIFLAAADFIGGYLTELNITSPSAIRQINEVTGLEVHKAIVDAMLAEMKLRLRLGQSVNMATANSA
jgi:glutathione synthase